MHVVAGKAICFGEALQDDFRAYGKAVIENAKTLAEELMRDGLRLISGGTDNHLMLVDVTSIGLGGKQAEKTLDSCGITVNMNMIPFDTRKPMDPSGIRIGTPALTTRGMGTTEMKQVARWISQALRHIDDVKLHEATREEIRSLCQSFPVPAAQLTGV